MANATDLQVQQFSDERVRVRCEQLRDVVASLDDDKGAIDDVYAACNAGSPTWSDNRIDGPPHLLAPSDMLAYNALMSDLITYIKAHGAYWVIAKSCVRPIGL